MATTGENIITLAEEILQDSSNNRWSEAQLLAWINYGQRAVVREKPDSNPVLQSLQLAAGLWQTLPANSLFLLDVTHNMGITGTARGDPCTIVERKWLDAACPGWASEAANVNAVHIVYDPRTLPKKFGVYPQSPGTNYLEIVTAVLPSNLALKADTLGLDDEYAEAVLEYVLFRAFSRDADYVQNAQRAMAHYQNFMLLLGKLDQVESLFYPKKGQGGTAE